MWIGVTIGFAGVKFSTSFNNIGLIIIIDINIIIMTRAPKMSLWEKKGWNGIFSKLELLPSGLFEPVSCSNIKWMITNAERRKGNKKCNVKNRVRVALLIENPPQIQITIKSPKYGIADSKLVITVAPQ